MSVSLAAAASVSVFTLNSPRESYPSYGVQPLTYQADATGGRARTCPWRWCAARWRRCSARCPSGGGARAASS
eukprot:1019122-Pyramimonas_sp.AAC.2